jgi:hypothetical protein
MSTPSRREEVGVGGGGKNRAHLSGFQLVLFRFACFFNG